MALYDYRCPSCEHTQEINHRMDETPEIKCEKCGIIMKRIISGGSGFIVKSGSTRNRNDRARYGKKRGCSLATPTESAFAKAEQKREEKKNAFDPSNPYKDV